MIRVVSSETDKVASVAEAQTATAPPGAVSKKPLPMQRSVRAGFEKLFSRQVPASRSGPRIRLVSPAMSDVLAV